MNNQIHLNLWAGEFDMLLLFGISNRQLLCSICRHEFYAESSMAKSSTAAEFLAIAAIESRQIDIDLYIHNISNCFMKPVLKKNN